MNEKETQDYEADNSSDKGMIELTSVFRIIVTLKRMQQNLWQTTSK